MVLSRTEQRVGGVAASGAAAAAPAAALSPKMQREMARTLARESNAARRWGDCFRVLSNQVVDGIWCKQVFHSAPLGCCVLAAVAEVAEVGMRAVQ